MGGAVLADSNTSVLSGGGTAWEAPQCSHFSRVTTRNFWHFGQRMRAGHSCKASIKTRPTQPKKKPTSAQPMQRTRQKAWRRASTKQPSALAAAANKIKVR